MNLLNISSGVSIRVFWSLLCLVAQGLGATQAEYQTAKLTIIEDAIALAARMPETDKQLLAEEVLALKDRIIKNMKQCCYEEALAVAVEGLEKFPRSFLLQTYLAVFIGDLSGAQGDALRERMVSVSKQMFTKLMKSVHVGWRKSLSFRGRSSLRMTTIITTRMFTTRSR